MSIKNFLLLKLDKNIIGCYIRDWYREYGNICQSYHWEIWGLDEEMMEWAVKSSFILRLEVVHGTFPVWAPLLLLSHFSPTLCDPIDGSPPGSAVPGILQARTLEWVAISFSSAWKWKVKVKSLSHVWAPLICTKSQDSRVRDAINFMKNRMTSFCKRETWICGSLFWIFWFYIITNNYMIL